jgi:hypothetical protein
MFSWELSPSRLDNADDRPADGNRRANAGRISRMNEVSYISLNFTLLKNGRSASIDAQPAAREPLKLQALGHAIGNSVLSCWK